MGSLSSSERCKQMKTLAEKTKQNKTRFNEVIQTRCYERPKKTIIQSLPKGFRFTWGVIFVLILK